MTWDQIRHFHRQPKFIALWLQLFGPALRALTPARRRFLLAVAALYAVFTHPWKELTAVSREGPFIGTAAAWLILGSALFGFFWLSYLAAKNFSRLPESIRRHPQIALHTLFWIPAIALWNLPPANVLTRTVLAGWIAAVPLLLWRVGYMMMTAQHGKMTGTRFADHLFYCFPVWTRADVPYGKGWDYLSANEARDADGLAKSQLAGVKLFLLAGLWTMARDLVEGVIFGTDNAYRRLLGTVALPRPGELFAHPESHSVAVSWASLYFELFQHVLALAVLGHIIIGWMRFFGFNVFRNTYQPLLAQSVVEFWNRYFYYFKELLVNFFFYPTFTRYFKGRPRLRLLAAVFAAAFAGNIYYHCVALKGPLVRGNLIEVWAAMQSRVFYSFLLAAGIGVSMLREQSRARQKKPARGIARQIFAIFLVWTFFAIIHIWARDDPDSFVARCRFFVGLFRLR
ncbi:MAG TPA: hypothetical protein VJ719_07170 [Chthoniobacterales bacterium]|nr:hypothetical protein [Chthoniobacterales bacterium]